MECPLLLLPDSPAPALTSALEQLYTCGQLENIFGLKQERKKEVIDNQNLAEEITNQEHTFKIRQNKTCLEFSAGEFVDKFEENENEGKLKQIRRFSCGCVT